MAGILKYFKPVALSVLSALSSASESLPDLDGPLDEKVPSKAIELANAEVKLLKESPHAHGGSR